MTAGRERKNLSRKPRQYDVRLLEAHHRIVNSLQIIANIFLMKMRSSTSEEAKIILQDMHGRLMAIAVVQSQICAPGWTDEIEFDPYLAKLCDNLASAMAIEEGSVIVAVSWACGLLKTEDAVNLGLIVAELVINSFKHGFPDGRKGRIEVDFVADGQDWRLRVSDNGVGRQFLSTGAVSVGLGTRIIESLVRHLKARMRIVSNGTGMATLIERRSRPN